MLILKAKWSFWLQSVTLSDIIFSSHVLGDRHADEHMMEVVEDGKTLSYDCIIKLEQAGIEIVPCCKLIKYLTTAGNHHQSLKFLELNKNFLTVLHCIYQIISMTIQYCSCYLIQNNEKNQALNKVSTSRSKR